MLKNYTNPLASGLKDVEGNGNSHPKNRQDVRVSNMGTTSISLPKEEYMMLGCWNPQGFIFLYSLDITPYGELLKDWVWRNDSLACGELLISK